MTCCTDDRDPLRWHQAFSETDAVVVDRVLGPVDLRHHRSTDALSVHMVACSAASLAALGEAAYLAPTPAG
jgi:hypothetical protein